MIVLKAWCGDCTAEGVENPGRLGVVQREDDGSHRWMPTARNGCYLTIGHSMRGAVGRNKIGPEELSPLVMSTPRVSSLLVPEFLQRLQTTRNRHNEIRRRCRQDW